MTQHGSTPHFDTVVVGGGQAGLAMGYYLAKQDRHFVILNAGEKVGDTWRARWDSLRLFTPARYSSLPGMPFPIPGGNYPTKDEMGDYLEAYAAHFNLPVRTGVKVESLTSEKDRYILLSNAGRFEATNVVVATGWLRQPVIPRFSMELDPQIVQLHSSTYKNPNNLPKGNVLVVGDGNSGAEIAVELSAAGRRVWLSGRDVGHIPFGLSNPLTWWLLTSVLTADSRLGRRLTKRSGFRARSGGGSSPLIRLKPKDILQAGVERVPRTKDVVGGKPRLEDGRILDVEAVVWATGFRPDFEWIRLAIFSEDGHPIHLRGVVEGEPGLYFLGLPFQHTFASALIGGVGVDAQYVAEQRRSRNESGSQNGQHANAAAS
jgi:putative flavoprotein involved in K+ transport